MQNATTTTAHGRHPRQYEALAILDTLTERAFTAAQMRQLDDQDWRLIAQVIGVNPPSHETVDLVIATQMVVEGVRAEYGDNPFAGLT